MLRPIVQRVTALACRAPTPCRRLIHVSRIIQSTSSATSSIVAKNTFSSSKPTEHDLIKRIEYLEKELDEMVKKQTLPQTQQQIKHAVHNQPKLDANTRLASALTNTASTVPDTKTKIVTGSEIIIEESVGVTFEKMIGRLLGILAIICVAVTFFAVFVAMLLEIILGVWEIFY